MLDQREELNMNPSNRQLLKEMVSHHFDAW